VVFAAFARIPSPEAGKKGGKLSLLTQQNQGKLSPDAAYDVVLNRLLEPHHYA